jgi:hypothetical protein
MANKTVEEAAAAVGISPASAYRWMKLPAFIQRYNEVRREARRRARAKLEEAIGEAVGPRARDRRGRRTNLCRQQGYMEKGPRFGGD